MRAQAIIEYLLMQEEPGKAIDVMSDADLQTVTGHFMVEGNHESVRVIMALCIYESAKRFVRNGGGK